ncbi:hypothetical protein HRR83_007606 [Exophiala dermatitidis]|uniref:Zn(2)-C6 fungal-type domain-containing protein n=2 Tax=Exophiala dermatitidis TaxID=5970 RepID=H6BLE9_EXODN|nr:uncharacterized protein HMPREF1120_01049 [Exophiala dermatitidis NIH/UT8656]KAJ4507861.1 hypothetical protein HRR75_006571 [Exophiala dermatitidis]EHY52842.1 hypothetical protein HMPREF1120_01049 [Exophiala dermatitidis NIH/UT8656]KAJ4510003.1 hypothetical protein HRR74_007155 [Exophiala dermatitidis]KAJ4521744.1 hypothetical protein HRR73_002942 [Exophiala dermatitidis]KAJ4542776.1 hypothetical protein HRR78_006865 [Exophiala dermatitidis]
METGVKSEQLPEQTPPALETDPAEALESGATASVSASASGSARTKKKSKEKDNDAAASAKRRCVSTACIACRKRKSKCDGNLPKCAACASVYMTECVYAPHTDNRRKGVYKKDVAGSKAKNSTLQVLIQAILDADEDDVMDLVHQIRTCDNLEELAASITAQEKGLQEEPPDSPGYIDDAAMVPKFEAELSGKMGDLMLDGSVKFIGGTSNLIWLPEDEQSRDSRSPPGPQQHVVEPRAEAILSWTTVTQDPELILHFMNMYFCWHYAFFTTLAKELFYRDFLTGKSSQYCSPLLVNVMLALGCHFSTRPSARADPDDSSTTGDHFFAEAKRLLYENDEFANAKICTVQALALMSVREAGCGRESKGWVYSGMSFRMACDLGLNVDAAPINESSRLAAEDIDARRITFWGCFLFDKCWSNYLGRQPQLQMPNITVKKPEVFPSEDSEIWSAYTDSGIVQLHAQPARTRAVALQLSKLAEISSDLLTSFYNPQHRDKPLSKQAELKRLTDLHTRLEAWKQALPSEFEPREGQLPQVLLMHMFFQLLYIHLYRPFLRYTRSTSPLPAHVSPRKYCAQGAAAISKLLRLYKRSHGLRQICNIAIYIAHSACTIHLLNLPDKNARRDIIHGVKHLEEMGECWTAARRTLRVLQLCAERWKIEMPAETEVVYTRIKSKWANVTENTPSPISPPTLVSMAKQMASPPLPDLMAQNIQQHEQQRQRYSIQPSTGSLPVMVAGFSSAATLPPLAETIATRQSSSSMSLPPQAAADLRLDGNRQIPPSSVLTYLTQAQQDAWNAHQARLANTSRGLVAQAVGGGGGAAGSSNPSNATTAKLFGGNSNGGIDSLLEETQEWFFRDQNQLAVGFDNWGGDGGGVADTQQDWGSLDLSFFDEDNHQARDGSGSHPDTTTGNSPAYPGGGVAPLQQPRYSAYDTPGVVEGIGIGVDSYAGHYPESTSTHYGITPGVVANGMQDGIGINVPLDMAMSMGNNVSKQSFGILGPDATGQNQNRQKRPPTNMMTFDDEMYY